MRRRLEGCWLGLQLLALEDGDKEAVGAVLRRGQAQVVAAAGAGGADRLGPGLRGGVKRKIRRLFEKTLGLRLVLLVQERAGNVDEPAAGFHQARRTRKD